MYTKEEMLFISEQSNKILEILEDQLRNDESSLTQSDLQGAIDAVIMITYLKGKEKVTNIVADLKSIQSLIEGDNFTWENINNLIKKLGGEKK